MVHQVAPDEVGRVAPATDVEAAPEAERVAWVVKGRLGGSPLIRKTLALSEQPGLWGGSVDVAWAAVSEGTLTRLVRLQCARTRWRWS